MGLADELGSNNTQHIYSGILKVMQILRESREKALPSIPGLPTSACGCRFLLGDVAFLSLSLRVKTQASYAQELASALSLPPFLEA